jgi:hypothetical protein
MITRYPHNTLTYSHCGHRLALLADAERGNLVQRIERWREMVKREGVR